MSETNTTSPYLSVPATVAYLGGIVGPAQLARMRREGGGPIFSKCGGKRVLYARADLDGWLHSRRVANTAQGKALVRKTKAVAAKARAADQAAA